MSRSAETPAVGRPKGCGRTLPKIHLPLKVVQGVAFNRGIDMGWLFDIEHANLVSYLTSEEKTADAPRANYRVLHQFLEGLDAVAHGHRGIISSRPEWVRSVRATAEKASDRLDDVEERRSIGEQQDDLEPRLVREVLEPLRPLFSGYSIHGLIVAERPWQTNTEESDFFEEAALSSQGEGLILMPDSPPGLLHIVDPFPPLQALTTTPV